ncbi:MAG: hypothetical protein JWQ31_1694 [Mycobacterium sp.]|nr:hypothetical protein [Mycobacterium sp.]
MTTSQSPDFHLNRPGVLIAALPAVLGFVPEKSLVLVTVDRGEMGCVMRVDLSDDLVRSLEHVADVAAAARPDSAIAVVIDADGANCRMCNDEHRELAGLLTTCWPIAASNFSQHTSSTGWPLVGAGTAPTAAVTPAPLTTRQRRRWQPPRSWTAAGSMPDAPNCKR